MMPATVSFQGIFYSMGLDFTEWAASFSLDEITFFFLNSIYLFNSLNVYFFNIFQK